MSTLVDNRVVSMEFDNEKFEKNVSESLETLKNLSKTLDGMADSSSALDKLASAASTFSFDGIANAIDSINDKFSFLGIVGVQAMERIANAAIDAGIAMARSLSIDQISAGFEKYGEKTKSVATIMSATGKGIEEVNRYLEQLMWYSDETSYNFTDMTNNIGKFTSSGVELKTAVSAMEGISNWAAISGQGISEAGRAMYNLAQAISVGSVKLMDWRSIENANMATTEFKQTVIDTALAVGTLEKAGDKCFVKGNKEAVVSVTNFNSELSKEWFTSEVLLKTLEKYGGATDKIYAGINKLGGAENVVTSDMLHWIDQYKKGILDIESLSKDLGVTAETLTEVFDDLTDKSNDFGIKTLKAAQEAKTFRDAIDATADAVSSGWMKTFELIFGDYTKAKGLWTDMANNLWDIFASGAAARNAVLKDASWSNWEKLAERVTIAGVSIDDFKSRLIAAAKEHGILTDEMINGWESFEDGLKDGWLSGSIIASVVESFKTGTGKIVETGGTAEEALEKVRGIVQDILHDAKGTGWGDGHTRTENFIKAGYDAAKMKNLVDRAFSKGVNSITLDDLTDLFIEGGEAALEYQAAIDEINLDGLDFDMTKVSGWELLRNTINNVLMTVSTFLSKFKEAWSEVVGSVTSDTIYDILTWLEDFSGRALAIVEESELLMNVLRGISAVAAIVKRVFKGLSPLLSPIAKIFKLIGKSALKLVEYFYKLYDKTQSLLGAWSPLYSICNIIAIVFNKILDAGLKLLSNVFSPIKAKLVESFGSKWETFGKKIKDFKNTMQDLTEYVKNTKIEDIFKDIIEKIKKLKFSPTGIIDKIKNAFAEVKTAIQTYLAGVDFKTLFSTLWNNAKDLGTSIYNFLKDALVFAFEAFKTSLKTICAKFRKKLNWWKYLGKLQDDGSMSEVFSFKTLFSHLKAQFIRDYPELTATLSKISVRIETAFTNFKEKIASSFTEIIERLKNLKTKFANNTILSGVLDVVIGIFDNITNLLQGKLQMPEWVTTVCDAIAKAFNYIIEYLQNSELVKSIMEKLSAAFDSIYDTLMKVGRVVALYEALNLADSFAAINRGLAKILKGVARILNAVSGWIRAKAFKEIGKGIHEIGKMFLDLALTFAIVVATLFAIPYLDDQKIKEKFDSLKWVFLGIGATFAIMARVAGNVSIGAAVSMIVAAVALRLAIKPLKELADEASGLSMAGGDFRRLTKLIGEALIMVGGILAIAGYFSPSVKNAIAMIAAVYSIKKLMEPFSEIIKLAKSMIIDDIIRIFLTVLSAVVLLGGILAAAGGFNVNIRNAIGMIAAVYAIEEFVEPFEKLAIFAANTEWKDILKMLVICIEAVILLGGVMAAARLLDWGSAVALAVIAIAMKEVFEHMDAMAKKLNKFIADMEPILGMLDFYGQEFMGRNIEASIALILLTFGGTFLDGVFAALTRFEGKAGLLEKAANLKTFIYDMEPILGALDFYGQEFMGKNIEASLALISLAFLGTFLDGIFAALTRFEGQAGLLEKTADFNTFVDNMGPILKKLQDYGEFDDSKILDGRVCITSAFVTSFIDGIIAALTRFEGSFGLLDKQADLKEFINGMEPILEKLQNYGEFDDTKIKDGEKVITSAFAATVWDGIIACLVRFNGDQGLLAKTDNMGEMVNKCNDILYNLKSYGILYSEDDVKKGRASISAAFWGTVWDGILGCLVNFDGDNGLLTKSENMGTLVDNFGPILKKLRFYGAAYKEENVQEGLDSINAVFKETGIMGIVSKIQSFFNLDEALATKVYNVCEIFDSVHDMYGTLASIGNDYDTDTMKAIVSDIQDVIESFEVDGRVASYEKINTKATLVTNAIGALSDALDGWTTSLNSFKTTITSIMDTLGEESITTFKNSLLDELKKAVSSLETAMENLGNSMGKKFYDGLMSYKNMINAAGQILGNQAMSGLRSTSGGAYDVGYNIASGLASGINGGTSLVTRAAASIVSTALSAARSVAKIRSPSRKFMEIGNYMSEGMAIGINDGTGQVEASMYDMTNSAILLANALANSIDESVISPVITPVIDLTKVQEGVDAIVDMFNTDSRSFDMSSSISSALGIQNRGNEKVVVTLDAASLNAIIANSSKPIESRTSIEFEGSLSQLASVLHPYIRNETRRVGQSLVNS